MLTFFLHCQWKFCTLLAIKWVNSVSAWDYFVYMCALHWSPPEKEREKCQFQCRKKKPQGLVCYIMSTNTIKSSIKSHLQHPFRDWVATKEQMALNNNNNTVREKMLAVLSPFHLTALFLHWPSFKLCCLSTFFFPKKFCIVPINWEWIRTSA